MTTFAEPLHLDPEPQGLDVEAADHLTDMADRMNDAAASDEVWRCCKCGKDCESVAWLLGSRMALCCKEPAYRSDDGIADRRGAAPVALPSLIEVPATPELREALERVLAGRELTGDHRRELECLRLQVICARLHIGRTA